MRAFASRASPGRAHGAPPAAQPAAPAHAGNLQLMQALGVRARLSVSRPADAAEQEADRMAERFVSAPDLHVARKCASCAEDEIVHRKAAPSGGGELAEALPELRGSQAQALPGALRSDFERFFDTDFSSVRVHAGAPAAQASAALNAQAFTRGRDIYFAQGEYRPESTEGKKLLAHEITHVAQNASEGSRARARPAAAIQRQLYGWVDPLVEGGGRFAPYVEGFQRVGPIVEQFGQKAGPLVEQTWRAPPPVTQPMPAPPTGPWWTPQTFPLPPVYPAPNVGPQPQPAPQPQPQPGEGEEEERDPRCGAEIPLTRVTFFPGPLGQGGRVKASPLTKCPGNTIGSEPLGSIYRDQFDCINAAGQGGSWVRAHLLHGRTSSSGPFNLHGPGNTPMNLIITDQSLNQQMRRGAEAPAIGLVWGASQALWYESKVDAYSPGLDYFGQSITVDYGAYNTATSTEGPRLGGGTFTLKRTPPNCPATPLAGVTPGAAGPGGITPAVVAGAGPAQAGAQGAPPAGTSLVPQSNLAFTSTLQFCWTLRSRQFPVNNGGVVVRLNVELADEHGGAPPGSCPTTGYRVILQRKGRWFFEEDILDPIPLELGKGQTLSWRQLKPGDYMVQVEKTVGGEQEDPMRWILGESPESCCLRGEITVSTFDAPAPDPNAPQIA